MEMKQVSYHLKCLPSILKNPSFPFFPYNPQQSECRLSILSQQHMLFYMFSFISHCIIVIPCWSIITQRILFWSHLQRLVVEGFLQILIVTLGVPQFSSHSYILELAYLVTQSNSLSYILGLTHLVAFQVQLTQLRFRFSSLGLAHLITFQVQLNQLHSQLSLLSCILGLTHLI